MERQQLIFDIETVGENYDSCDATTQQMLTRWIQRESLDEEEAHQALQNLKNELGFSPLTGEIVAISMLDYQKKKGAVYFQAPNQQVNDFIEEEFVFRQMTEKEMLEKFWEGARQYHQFITFNGRAFDAPFLIIRSAIHKIKPTVNLMPYRYASDTNHIDLQDQLTFYGSLRRRGGLHLWSRAFGVKSPKADGITGDDVAPLFRDGKFTEIARYSVGDVLATVALYEFWRDYVRW